MPVRIIFLLLLMFSVPVRAAEGGRAILFQTDWQAQAEHGGFYLAVADGLYAAEGLDVRIRPGGPNVNIGQLVATGAVDIALSSNAFQPLNFLAAGVDARVVAAIFQKDPQILMTHPGRMVRTLAELKGRPTFVAAGAIGTFWPWLRTKFDFEDAQLRRYSYSLAPWLNSPDAVQEGYLSSEPYLARQAGIEPQVHLLADHGYPGYAAMILVRGALIRDEPDVVQGFVNASIEGWLRYMTGSDAPANKRILADNPEMTPELIAYSIDVMREHGIVISGDALSQGVGAMTAMRWRRFADEMKALGLFAAELDETRTYDLRFLHEAWRQGFGRVQPRGKTQ